MAQKPIETLVVQSSTVGCDGGGGALGHPLIYLTLGKEGFVECPYCSRRYVMDPDAAVQHGH